MQDKTIFLKVCPCSICFRSYNIQTSIEAVYTIRKQLTKDVSSYTLLMAKARCMKYKRQASVIENDYETTIKTFQTLVLYLYS